MNANGNLINEGIVTSMALLQELSNELVSESQQLFRLKSQFGTYIGFNPAIPGVEHIGIRLLGNVALKGLDNIEVGEIVPFAQGEAEAMPLETNDPLVIVLRTEFHRDEEHPFSPIDIGEDTRGSALHTTTTERLITCELVVCVPNNTASFEDVLIGEWDPRTDDINRPLRIPRDDLLSHKGRLNHEVLEKKKQSVRDLYERLATETPALPLSEYRAGAYDAFVLGDVVEKL
jgi:hypothetical protein